jgi:hypothetical protein
VGQVIFSCHKGSRLEQLFPGMVLEDFSVAHVAAQSVHALVPGLIGHLKYRSATSGGRCQEAGAQRMTTKFCWISQGRALAPPRLRNDVSRSDAWFAATIATRKGGDAGMAAPVARRLDVSFQ